MYLTTELVMFYSLYFISLSFFIAMLKVIILGSFIFKSKFKGILLYFFGFISFSILFYCSYIIINNIDPPFAFLNFLTTN